MPRERWLDKRKDEILPTSYFHVVFTLPHELNTLILNNKKVMLNILFKAASQTLLTFRQTRLYCHFTHLGSKAKGSLSSALPGCRGYCLKRRCVLDTLQRQLSF
jgi:hypothetical protein